MKHIGLIGAGSIGLRHLQGIVSLSEAIHVDVVDISENSLKNAKKHMEEIQGWQKHVVRFLSSLDAMAQNLDLVIIATGSLVRRQIIEELLSKKFVQYMILEKFMFPCVQDYQDVSQLLLQKETKAWVNCLSRYFPGYKQIKKELENTTFEYNLSGGSFGLACNSIHFLDMICFLSNDTNYELYSNMLDPYYIKSKRSGYIEFTGTLYGKNKRCSFFSFHASAHQTVNYHGLFIRSKHTHYLIEQGKQKVIVMGDENHWQAKERDFAIPYQSETTPMIIDQLFKTNDCELPSYTESMKIHIPYLRLLGKHYRSDFNDSMICPIT